ncbi:MAG TPA: serine/threonine-protein kinase [Mycobacteriales bacterium]|nr:serine/threonine-protein kinase [Mycobacteriales bacterium]
MDGDLGALRSALPSYDVGAVLGRGAWGTVVEARHRGLNRSVAIKWLRPELVDDEDARSRFNAEAQVLAALDHPHVVRVYDYVEINDVCALVMERLPGGTIADRARLGPLPPQTACAYTLAALHGLEHAHHHDVLHRDVKPENLMLAGDGRLRVTDFGIAAIVGDRSQRQTQTGIALGTPAYMAPEQLTEPDRIGEHTDVWSTSAVLYELLAGQVPYEPQPTLHAALLKRANEDPRPVTGFVPDLPPRLAEAVMKGLARTIENRFPTCLDAADAIDAAAFDAWGSDWLARTGIPLQRTPPRQRAGATGAVPLIPAKPTKARPPKSPRPRSRRRLALASLAAVVATGAAGGAVVVTGNNPFASKSPHAAAGAKSAPDALPPVPAGWGDHLNAGVAVPSVTSVAEFGSGALDSYTFTGDPVAGADFRSLAGSAPAATQVQDIQATGAVPYLSTYMLRTTGHLNDDQSGKGVLKILRSPKLMKPYWESTIELLKELESVGKPVFLVVDLSVPANVQSAGGNDPRAIPAAVDSSGVTELRGLPNSFAGWAQAWVTLRNSLAPQVKLGWSVDSYGVGDYLIPNRPSDPVLAQYQQAFKEFYGRLGTKFDFIDYTVGYGDGAKIGPEYVARPSDITTLQHWVADMVSATGDRVVLDSIPAGNTVMRAVDNTDFHWQDRYVQFLLGDDPQSRARLTGLRDAGVMGLLFGPGYSAPEFTCPCDSAGDGKTDPPASGTSVIPSYSADDDGGYLAQRLTAYAASGRLTL